MAGGGRLRPCRRMDLPASVAPFILRGVCPLWHRLGDVPAAQAQRGWKALETGLDRQKLAAMTREIGLAEVIGVAPDILAARCAAGSWSRPGKRVMIYRRKAAIVPRIG